MKVVVIIVNYNQEKLLKACLESVMTTQYEADFDVVVVDNNSTDQSVVMLKKNFPNVHIISMSYNSGFCKGCNVGIEYAKKQNAHAVVLLNNDTVVQHNFLQYLVSGLKCGDRVGMVAGRIHSLPDRSQIDTAGILVTPDGLGKTRGFGAREIHDTAWDSVFCPSGSGGLFLMEMLEDIKMEGQYFDEDYKFYVEEVDLAWRAQLRGWKCAYIDQARAYHKRSSTSKKYPALRIFHANRNVYYNIIKNYPSVGYVCKALFLAMIKYPILLGASFFRKGVVVELSKEVHKRELMYLYCKGMMQVVLMLPALLKKRKKIQSRKTISKKDVKRIFAKQGLSFWEAILKL